MSQVRIYARQQIRQDLRCLLSKPCVVFTMIFSKHRGHFIMQPLQIQCHHCPYHFPSKWENGDMLCDACAINLYLYAGVPFTIFPQTATVAVIYFNADARKPISEAEVYLQVLPVWLLSSHVDADNFYSVGYLKGSFKLIITEKVTTCTSERSVRSFEVLSFTAASRHPWMHLEHRDSQTSEPCFTSLTWPNKLTAAEQKLTITWNDYTFTVFAAANKQVGPFFLMLYLEMWEGLTTQRTE